jgi:hypothetical protein
MSDWEQSDPHVDYRFLLTRVEKCENWTRVRENEVTYKTMKLRTRQGGCVDKKETLSSQM